jgi:hypothetical protein
VVADADHEREAELLPVGGVGARERLELLAAQPVQPGRGLLALGVDGRDLAGQLGVGADERDLARARRRVHRLHQAVVERRAVGIGAVGVGVLGHPGGVLEEGAVGCDEGLAVAGHGRDSIRAVTPSGTSALTGTLRA